MSRATLLQMTPAVYGTASEPRTLTMRPSSSLTVRLQVSGQSKVQTLARSSMAMGSSLLPRRYRGSDWQFFGLGVAASVLEPAVFEPNPRLVEAIEPACSLSGWGQFLDALSVQASRGSRLKIRSRHAGVHHCTRI